MPPDAMCLSVIYGCESSAPKNVHSVGHRLQVKRIGAMPRASLSLELMVESESFRDGADEQLIGYSVGCVGHESPIWPLDHYLAVLSQGINAAFPEPASEGQIEGYLLHEAFDEGAVLRHGGRIT